MKNLKITPVSFNPNSFSIFSFSHLNSLLFSLIRLFYFSSLFRFFCSPSLAVCVDLGGSCLIYLWVWSIGFWECLIRGFWWFVRGWWLMWWLLVVGMFDLWIFGVLCDLRIWCFCVIHGFEVVADGGEEPSFGGLVRKWERWWFGDFGLVCRDGSLVCVWERFLGSRF